MITCTRRLEFDAGHRVPLHESKCKTPHGHRYVVEVECGANGLTPEGFVIDFGLVKQLLGAWVDNNLDHTTIVQSGDPFGYWLEKLSEGVKGLRPVYAMEKPPTAENLAELLHMVGTNLLKDHGVRLTSVTVWETPNCKATYRP